MQWETYSKTEPIGAWRFLNSAETLRTLSAALQRLSSGSKGKAPPPVSKM
jgi:hypothetical protein